MSNPYPSGYPSVPVSSGLMNSPHSYTGSPGPMPNVMNQGMSSMGSTMGPGINPVMNPGMNPGISPGMASGIPPGLVGPGGGSLGISNMGVMHSNMQSGISSVLSSALGANMNQPLSSRMSPVMASGMQHPMQTMGGGMAGPIAAGLGPGMSPMPMQYSMGPQQSSAAQGQTGLTPTSGATNSTSGNSIDSGTGAAPGPGPSSRLVTPGSTSDNSSSQSSRDINTASLCRIGQETVQDIISRTQEIFQTLKTIQPPNGTAAGANAANEKKLKVQEQLRTIRILFKRLRLIYEKCNDNSQLQGMEYTHIESLIPLKDEWDGKSEERKNSEPYRQATEEHKQLLEAVSSKNRLLKDIIDHMRRIIWEINTMLIMRRS